MATLFYLTDELADLQPASGTYRRLKLGARSDGASLVRSVTSTAAGPSSGIQITRTAGGSALAWISDPLSGTDLGAVGSVEFHIWAKESAVAANAALRFQVYVFTTAEAGSALHDLNAGTELTTLIADSAQSNAAAAQALAPGDRLVLKLLVDDAGTLGASQTVTVSYNGLYGRSEGDSYVSFPDTLTLAAQVPAATRLRIRRILMDTAEQNQNLDDAEIDRALEAALAKYNRDRTRFVTASLDGDNATYDFPLPAGWIWGYSRLEEIEYPVGAQQRTVLEKGDYEVIESLLGSQPVRSLHFPILIPESGTGNLLLRYTTKHVHNDVTDTIPADDFDALCMLAGSYAALSLAARDAQSSDATIMADSVDHRDGEERWRSVSRALMERYLDHIGAGGSPAAPASAIVDWDTNLFGGRDRIFHGRRWH